MAEREHEYYSERHIEHYAHDEDTSERAFHEHIPSYPRPERGRSYYQVPHVSNRRSESAPGTSRVIINNEAYGGRHGHGHHHRPHDHYRYHYYDPRHYHHHHHHHHRRDDGHVALDYGGHERIYYLPRARSESEHRHHTRLIDYDWSHGAHDGDWRARRRGSHYDNWQTTVVFEPDEAALKPTQWLEKLEKLEAQVLSRSAIPDDTFLGEPIQLGHTQRELGQCLRVLQHARDNLLTMQAARFCGGSFNILVAERSSPQVARLVGIGVTEVDDLVSRVRRFVEGDIVVNRRPVTELLQECADFLDSIGLGLAGFDDWREPQDRLRTDRGYEAREWTRYKDDEANETRAALAHALRALAYVLDIGVCSFCGAHLEPFDEVYFPRQHDDHYTIHCGVAGKIVLSPRHFRCLEGFLGQHPAWVLAAYEPHQAINLDAGQGLYLHTTVEQLTNIWGPMWRVESRHRDRDSRFALTNGFIVATNPGHHHPPLRANETLCHWTASREEAGTAPGFPRHANVRYLLIGAAASLDENRYCPTNSGEVYTKFFHRRWVYSVGVRAAKWYVESYSLSITLAPAGSPVNLGLSLAMKRRKGVTCKDVVLSLVDSRPMRCLGPLNEFYGVEISGCTGNARRRSLRDILTTRTVRALVEELEPNIDDNTWNEYASALARGYGPSHDATRQRLFEKFLRISVITLKDIKSPSILIDHVTALYATSSGAYSVWLPTTRCDWLRLFSDNLESFTAPVIETNCLECEHGPRLFCHHLDRRLHSRPITSVLESAVLLNEEAPLPRGLEAFANSTVTPEMVQSIPTREIIDLGPRGTLRVLGCVRVHGGYALVVERLRSFTRLPRKVRFFFQKVAGRVPQENYHSERFSSEHSLTDCVPVLVVSNRKEREIAEWLAAYDVSE